MGTVAVFAVLPDFMDNCSQAYAALGQRLETDMLYDHRQIPGWCSPVTKVSKLSTIADETVFLEEAVKLGLMTGLRPNELRELSQDQIQYSSEGSPYLLIEGHKTAKTNGEAKPRTVPLSKKAEEIVDRQIKKHPDKDVVFLNGKREPYTRTVYRNRLIRWSRRSGIGDITPYALRHSFASIESDAGVETTSLASLMGHSQSRTLQRYVSNSFDSHLDAVEKVSERISKAMSLNKSEIK